MAGSASIVVTTTPSGLPSWVLYALIPSSFIVTEENRASSLAIAVILCLTLSAYISIYLLLHELWTGSSYKGMNADDVRLPPLPSNNSYSRQCSGSGRYYSGVSPHVPKTSAPPIKNPELRKYNCDDFGCGSCLALWRRFRQYFRNYRRRLATKNNTTSDNTPPTPVSPPFLNPLRRSPSSSSGTPPTPGGVGGGSKGKVGEMVRSVASTSNVVGIRSAASEVDVRGTAHSRAWNVEIVDGLGSKGETTRMMFYMLLLVANLSRFIFTFIEATPFLITFLSQWCSFSANNSMLYSSTYSSDETPPSYTASCGCYCSSSSDRPHTPTILCVFLRTAPSFLFATAFSIPVLLFGQLVETLLGRFSALPRPIFVGINVAVYLMFLSNYFLCAIQNITYLYLVRSTFFLLALTYAILSVIMFYFGTVLHVRLSHTTTMALRGGRALLCRINLMTIMCGILFAYRAAGLLLSYIAGGLPREPTEPNNVLNYHFNAGGLVIFETVPCLFFLVVMHQRKGNYADGRGEEPEIIETTSSPRDALGGVGMTAPSRGIGGYGGRPWLHSESMPRVSSSGGGYHSSGTAGGSNAINNASGSSGRGMNNYPTLLAMRSASGGGGGGSGQTFGLLAGGIPSAAIENKQEQHHPLHPTSGVMVGETTSLLSSGHHHK